ECIIATAAYGSEMAPEVQFLRGFRDHTVLSTFAGSSFMDAFNSFYYSWSPGVADSIRDVEEAKAFTRGMIVPLLGVLSVSFYAYNLFSFSPEFGVILAGFLASSMLGAIYMTLPTIALLRLAPRSKRNMIIRRGIVILLGLSSMGFAFTLLGVYSSSSSLAMFGSATLVLSSMFATALIVSFLGIANARPTYRRISSMWHVITDPIRARS
ncbi:MAG: CFI-box-CTERM domain-containing protein, partial [Nitrososphaerales archaeon]